MDAKPLSIPDVIVLTPRRFADERGYFEETWNKRTLADAGITVDFVQDNQSLSRPVGTLRGLHFQAPPHAQSKLVRVIKGAVLDVAVDIRRASPTFGQWVSAELSEENGAQIFVPRGFAHAFLTLRPDTIVAYKCDNFYHRDADGGIRYDDPDLAIDWPIPAQGEGLTVSAKDRNLPALKDLEPIF